METKNASPGPYRVLVVDDAVDVAAWLGIMLRQAGYEARTAGSGSEALAVAAEFCPKAVLLDIGLPDMDGYEVARQLLARPGGEGSVLIATTGWGDAEDKQRSLRAGFRHHLVKPVSPDKLLALLGELRGQSA